jgi:predicted transcriptional regulator
MKSVWFGFVYACALWSAAAVPALSPDALPDAAAPAATDAFIGNDIVAVYEAAVANLERVCDDYRRIKAMQQARQLDLAFEEAYANISSVMPVLAPINRELLRRAIHDPADIAAHKREVEQVEHQIEMMIDLVAKLFEEIEVVSVELRGDNTELPAREVTLEEIVQKPEYDPDQTIVVTHVRPDVPAYQQLEELARDDSEQPYKDLTPQLHALMPDIKDLTSEPPPSERRPVELFRSSDNVADLMRITNPKTPHTFGRIIGDGGAPIEWLFVNSWYTIGPFPNPMRLNLHTAFPPETVIDLAATYPGKGGRQVRWQWIQSNEPMMQPADPDQYGVYYAYTEVRCEQPMDLWIAVGSDDKANVWLNGLPVWVSSDQLKGWRVNEGFRKVTFRQGINRILYRVENGWLTLGFSLGIRVAP